MIDTTWTEFHIDGMRRAFRSAGMAAGNASTAFRAFTAANQDAETREFARIAHAFEHGSGPRSISRTARRALGVGHAEKIACRARRRDLRRSARQGRRG